MKNLKKRNKPVKGILAIFLIFILSMAGFSKALARDFYQIKVYTIETGEQGLRMDHYLEKAYLPALHRAGISKVGVFKPYLTEENPDQYIMVLIPFKSLELFEKLDGMLAGDKKYLKAGEDYINAAHDDAPYVRIQSTLLRSFKAMPDFHIPVHPTPRSEQIYELRSYEGSTEKFYESKVEMFNDEGEAQLFKDLGFQPMFFCEVISGAAMPNLMYMTTFSDSESQKEHWKSFGSSEEWNRMKVMEKYKNTVSHIDKFIMYPTEYSDL